MKTETGYAADLQAIADQIDRRDREIARKCEVIEKLSDKVQDRDDTIESLQKQLIERLAEINEKDRRIAELEAGWDADQHACRIINEIDTQRIAELEETATSAQRLLSDALMRIGELEKELREATALREREGR